MGVLIVANVTIVGDIHFLMKIVSGVSDSWEVPHIMFLNYFDPEYHQCGAIDLYWLFRAQIVIFRAFICPVSMLCPNRCDLIDNLL